LTSTANFPEFLKWGLYTSKDKENPDVLKVKVLDVETFDTEFSTNIRALVDEVEKIIPLHNFESKNKQLFKEFLKAKKEGKIKVGKDFKIVTYLGVSKANKEFSIRRFELVF
jgi:hypothetical protein